MNHVDEAFLAEHLNRGRDTNRFEGGTVRREESFKLA
jgi:hypothetical protein